MYDFDVRTRWIKGKYCYIITETNRKLYSSYFEISSDLPKSPRIVSRRDEPIDTVIAARKYIVTEPDLSRGYIEDNFKLTWYEPEKKEVYFTRRLSVEPDLIIKQQIDGKIVIAKVVNLGPPVKGEIDVNGRVIKFDLIDSFIMSGRHINPSVVEVTVDNKKFKSVKIE